MRRRGGTTIPTVSPDSLIAAVDESFKVVPDARMSLFYRGENGQPVVNPNYPMSGGYTWLPRGAGMVSGTVRAKGYEDASFFVRVGGAGGGGGTTATTGEVTGVRTRPAILRAGESAVIKAVDDAGNTVEGVTVVVNGTQFGNPANVMVPDDDQIAVEVRRGGTTVWPQNPPATLNVGTAGAGAGGGGGGFPTTIVVILVTMAILAGIWKFRDRIRGILGRRERRV